MSNEQIDNYMQEHNLQQYFASLFQKVAVAKPKDPVDFLLQEIEEELKITENDGRPSSDDSLINKREHSIPPKILFVGNWMNENVLKLVAKAFNYTSVGIDSNSSARSLVSYVSNTGKENIKTRIDALRFQEKGYSPDIVVTTNITDYELFLRANTLDETIYSKQKFESELFILNEIIDVFSEGASLIINGNNELRIGVLASRVVFGVEHNRVSAHRYALVGAPGSGKTMHARILANLFNVPRLNPHEVLVELANQDSNSSLGKTVHKALGSDAGLSSLSDELVNRAMLHRIQRPDCSKGYIFDGFPSNKVQADFVVEMGLIPEVTAHLKVSRETCVTRLKGRQFHKETGEVFHSSFYPPANPNTVIQRPQDTNESLFEPLIRKYFIEEEAIISSLDALVTIDSNSNNFSTVKHLVVSTCYGEKKGIQRIFVIGAPLSNTEIVARSIAKEKGLIFISGSRCTDEAQAVEIVKKIRSYDCMHKGFVICDFPQSIEHAELLEKYSVMPTCFINIDLSSEQAAARAKQVSLEEAIEKEYFQYIANRGPVLNLFKSHIDKISYINGSQLLQKVISDAMKVVNGEKSQLKIIFCGAPGSGKGTQCEVIRDEYQLVHLSTGDILRDAVKKKTPLGFEASKYMNNGLLVPDSLIQGIIAERLKEKDCVERGYILDGFPRTEPQCRFLIESGNIPDAVILLEVPDEEIVPRITGRRMDPVTGNVYHLLFNPPPQEISGRLFQRSDDTEEKVKVRLVAYHQNVQGILDSFPEQICPVNGNQKKELVSNEVRAHLNRLKKYIQ